jgi:hypothetical protein
LPGTAPLLSSLTRRRAGAGRTSCRSPLSLGLLGNGAC